MTRISRSNRSQKHASTVTMARSLSFLPTRGTETLISFLSSAASELSRKSFFIDVIRLRQPRWQFQRVKNQSLNQICHRDECDNQNIIKRIVLVVRDSKREGVSELTLPRRKERRNSNDIDFSCSTRNRMSKINISSTHPFSSSSHFVSVLLRTNGK